MQKGSVDAKWNSRKSINWDSAFFLSEAGFGARHVLRDKGENHATEKCGKLTRRSSVENQNLFL